MKKTILFIAISLLMLVPVCAQALSFGYWNQWPTLGMQINNNLAGYVGFNSMDGDTRTNWYMVKVDCNLMKIGDVQTRAGIYYYANDIGTGVLYDPASAIGLTFGGAVMVTKSFSIGIDEILVQANANPSTTDIFPASTLSANIYF
jgi:hypothetical protein